MMEYKAIWIAIFITLCLTMMTCAKDAARNGFRTDNRQKLKINFTPMALDSANKTNFDFKVKYRQPEAAQSPRSEHFNEQYVGLGSSLIPREMDMPSILSQDEPNENTAMGAISRTFGSVKNENSLYEATEIEVWNPPISEVKSRRNRIRSYLYNPPQYSKLDRRDNPSLNRRDRRKANRHRTQKMRIAGLKVSNSGHKSSLLCPKIPLTTRTIVHCTKGRKVGSKCSLSCDQGFVPAGKRKSRRCKSPRRHRRKHSNNVPYWTGKQDDFQCVPVCQHMDLPEHGERECKTVNLPRGKTKTCTTKCDSGYKLVGTFASFCQEDGTWSGQPAVCKAASTRQTVKTGFKFRRHQSLPCGEAYGLASFRKDGVVYLVAGDKMGGMVKVFRWNAGKFDETPFQTFSYSSPEVVEVISAPDSTTWLIVSGNGPGTMYRLQPNGKFQRSHTARMFGGSKRAAGDTIGFAELRGEFYRCYGRNRRETPVIVVHKLQNERAPGRDFFHRIMRKKLPGERVHQCSLYTEADSLYTIATLKKPNGQGRVLVGQLTKNRMKVVDIVTGNRLQHVTDSFGFGMDGGRYIAVSQGMKNGKCLVYKRHWRTRPPEETG